MSTTRERLNRFYQKYNEEKIAEIDSVLEKYRGKEEQLFNALVKKYGPEPTSNYDISHMEKPLEKEADAGCIVPSFRSRLIAIYEKYNPEKLCDVDTVLEKYKGNEAKLFDALVRKYGPEPADEDEFDEQEDEENYNNDSLEKTIFRSVKYCPVCTLPAEYCEYGPSFEECKPWLLQNFPHLMLQKYGRTVSDLVDVEQQIAAGVEGLTLEVVVDKKSSKKKKKQAKKEEEKKSARVYIERFQRSKKKSVTIIAGMDGFTEGNLKDVAKKLGKKFACSASVNKTDSGGLQIQLQGDCVSDLPDLLVDQFSVPSKDIYFVEKGNIEPAF